MEISLSTLLGILIFCFIVCCDDLPVFPGAQGFGVSTPAGSGRHDKSKPRIFKVTTLNPTGEGSLKECVDASGPRFCIFEVSGKIQLDEGHLDIENPYITISGETAPSPGISLMGSLEISTHDVYVSHLFIRVGDDIINNPMSGASRDGIGISNYPDLPTVYNVVINHCSAAYAVDETYQIWGLVEDTTLINSFMTHSLDESIHEKDQFHSKGAIFGPGSKRNSVSMNLWAHHSKRNLHFGGGAGGNTPATTEFEMINNIIYNPYIGTTVARNYDLSPENLDPQCGHIINNFYRSGQDSTHHIDDSYVINIGRDSWNVRLDKDKFYIKNNIGGTRKTASDDDWANVVVYGDESKNRVEDFVFEPKTTRVFSPERAYNIILKNSGARPIERDSEDQTCVDDVINQSGQIVNCVSQNSESRCDKNVGGYPNFAENSRKFDVPSDYDSIEENGYLKIENILFEYSRSLEVISCFGIDKDDKSVCYGVGKCVSEDFCLYEGDEPYNGTCFGISSFNSSVCNGGICKSEDECMCDNSFLFTGNSDCSSYNLSFNFYLTISGAGAITLLLFVIFLIICICICICFFKKEKEKDEFEMTNF